MTYIIDFGGPPGIRILYLPVMSVTLIPLKLEALLIKNCKLLYRICSKLSNLKDQDYQLVCIYVYPNVLLFLLHHQ